MACARMSHRSSHRSDKEGGKSSVGRTLLLTGRPGVGKTTVIQKVANPLADQAGGFYTQEIRDSAGRRQGFRLVTLDGDEAVLAHTDLRGPEHPQVSRYGVDAEAVEKVGVKAIREAIASDKVIIVDEIGKMELYCEAFKEAVSEAIQSPSPVVATIMRGSSPWTDELKATGRSEVWEVTVDNRDVLPKQVRRWLNVDAKDK